MGTEMQAVCRSAARLPLLLPDGGGGGCGGVGRGGRGGAVFCAGSGGDLRGGGGRNCGEGGCGGGLGDAACPRTSALMCLSATPRSCRIPAYTSRGSTTPGS